MIDGQVFDEVAGEAYIYMVCNNTKRASLFHTKQTTPDARPVVGDPNPVFRLQTFKICGSVYVFHFTYFIRKSELVVLRSILFIKYDSNYQITEDMWWVGHVAHVREMKCLRTLV